MNDNIFNIYMTGVGGQGIGLLSQALLTAIDHAGLNAIAVDTHGLAQRGGVVVSRIRCGDDVHSPLIMKGQSHLILALEVHEAMRALDTTSGLTPRTYPTRTSQKEPSLCFLDVTWQPLPVRLGEMQAITPGEVEAVCRRAGIACHRVLSEKIEDPRMQNMALLGTVAANCLVPGVELSHYRQAMENLLKGEVLTNNLALFDQYASPNAT